MPRRHPGWAVTPGACLQRGESILAAFCSLPVPPPPRPAKFSCPPPGPPSVGSTEEVAPIPPPPQGWTSACQSLPITTTTYHPAPTWSNHPRGQCPNTQEGGEGDDWSQKHKEERIVKRELEQHPFYLLNVIYPTLYKNKRNFEKQFFFSRLKLDSECKEILSDC